MGPNGTESCNSGLSLTSLTNKSALTNSNCCDLFAAVIGKKIDKGAAVKRLEEKKDERMKNSKEKKKDTKLPCYHSLLWASWLAAGLK